jgi:hypothetical protein
MTATAQTTFYAVEGRLLEVCTCAVLCPCWVGENPDGDGTCDAILGWYVDRGTVSGVDVSDRCLCLSVHIPGNVLAGNWQAAMLVDDRCSVEQQTSLHDGAFSTIPRSPTYLGKADHFRRNGKRHGLPDVELSGRNAAQGSFRFSG